jgi:prepilin-type N-terminal cleavage/methylation domain-containing protein
MQLFNVRDSNRGFTLIEMLVIVVMVGIISAITAPSLLGMLNRSKINAAQAEVEGVIQEAQRQSIRSSKTGNLILDDVSLRAVSNSTAITSFWFNHKGELFTNSPTGSSPQRLNNPITVVISSANTSSQKCLVLSAPLGLLRSGTYIGAADTTTQSDCIARF